MELARPQSEVYAVVFCVKDPRLSSTRGRTDTQAHTSRFRGRSVASRTCERHIFFEHTRTCGIFGRDRIGSLQCTRSFCLCTNTVTDFHTSFQLFFSGQKRATSRIVPHHPLVPGMCQSEEHSDWSMSDHVQDMNQMPSLIAGQCPS